MPEDYCIVSDLERALDHSEDYTFNVHNYQAIQNALDADNNIQIPVVEKLLSICVRELKEDMKYTSNILNIISTTLKKIKEAQLSPLPDLVPSAVGVLHILKTTALFNKVEALKALCFEIIVSYPDETLISLVVNQSNELMELFNLYCHQRIPLKIRLQILNIISKLLKILPPEKRATFVKEGVNIWFSKIIPFITITSALPQVLDVVEMLTEDLVHIDYSDNPHWRSVLENIYTPQKYPAVMKSLLETNNDNWHRLWMIFIRLLKSQITKSTSNTGSPINSMLPVVEMAFKMDVQNRCKAFLCWNVLIDNFSTETNEMYINKRIKLLVIPLTSNNAKVEETALAKLNTWWHLITSFYDHLDKISNIVLMPFLYFCFGKFACDKPVLIPGMISEKTKAQCVQAFININGHSNCEGCVNFPKLKGKLLTTTLIVDHWQDWIHFMNVTFKICAANKDFMNKQIECVWRSFVLTIAKLPENNIRRDLFLEVVGLLGKLSEGCNNRMNDIILNVLILFLLDNMEIRPLLLTKEEQPPIHKIVQVILKLLINNLDNRQIVNHLKPLTNFLINEAFTESSHTIECILKDLPSNGLIFWVVLAETMCAKYYDLCQRMLCKMLLWPLQYMELFANEKLATLAWINLYKFVYSKLNKTSINDDVFKILMSHDGSVTSNKFIIIASITAAQKKIDLNDGNLENEAEWLLKAMSKVNVYKDIEDIHPDISQVVINMIKNVCAKTNEVAAKYVILIIEHMLKLFKHCTKENVSEDHIMQLELIFENLKVFLNNKDYSKLITLLLNELKSFAEFVKNKKTLREHILNTLNTGKDDTSVKEVIEILNENVEQKSNEENQKLEQNKFTTPSGKPVAKKSKRKEASIVNTVVENGEEFVVVKSNWKFNPRKLTDNQKEKFQRKREDIPALYQDLSQSQDEFKMNTWKTDSQDTTTTTSKSNTAPGNDDVTTILKNMPNSEFVPKILENIIGKDKVVDSEETTAKDKSKIDSKTESKNDSNKLQIIKDTKSPRVALKDRVFKNVKSLMEKSNVNNENSIASSNISENIPKTPIIMKSIASNIINSAPTLISADRPSRLKRKPKKFEDLQIFGLKKRRHSLGQSDSQTDGESSDNNSPDVNILEEPKNDKAVNEIKAKGITNIEIKNVSKETSIPDTNETCADFMEPSKADIILDEKMENTDYTAKETSEDKIVLNSNATQIEEQETITQTPEVPAESSDKNLPTPKPDKSLYTPKPEKSLSTPKPEKNLCTPKLDKNLSMPKPDKNLSTPKPDKNLSTPKPVKNLSTPKPDTNISAPKVDKNLSTPKPEKSLSTPKSDKSLSTPKPDQNLSTPKSDKSLSTPKPDQNLSTTKPDKNLCTPKPDKNLSTPKTEKNNLTDVPKSSTKKASSKKSRIEKELAIDMVEGHPFLNTPQPEKRLTRKAILNSPCTRKNLTEKSNKNKTEKKINIIDKDKSVSLKETQNNTEDILESQDVIESSQESAITTISVKSNKTPKKDMVIVLEDLNSKGQKTQSLIDDISNDAEMSSKDDVELSRNRTADDKVLIDLTENMDTEPMSDNFDVIVINDEEDQTVNEIEPDQNVQNTAEADTQTLDSQTFAKEAENDNIELIDITENIPVGENTSNMDNDITNASLSATADDVTKTMSESQLAKDSPFKDEEQRKMDFMNNTLEISPIKTLSPVEEKKSPPENNDYVVIKLSSPVQGNGEPFEKCESPEIFTEEKSPPRDQSPVREESNANNTSPSSSLSLKKNRPQVRSNGRAAQMLGLCVPDMRISDEDKKSPSVNSSARRNLRIMYNTSSEQSESVDESEESENFLRLKRMLPSTDCSPSGPILKRKLADITDEATASPASKRKRVSFHDPPVSTTICVKKYIEPCGVRSPQNSAIKRQERLLKSQLPTKSPKRLENVFKLDSVLTKTVESFSENTTPDTEMSSSEATPVVEIVKTSDLNDIDPLCPDLIDCNDSISNIATELSSPAMKVLLIKEFEGKIETVGDLAKLTELEVNRLCIKTPKVQTARKVLIEYLNKITQQKLVKETDVPENKSVEVQANVLVENMGMQTEELVIQSNTTQTELPLALSCSVQTDQSGSSSTTDIISTCISERTDFVEKLCEKMDDASKLRIADDLSFNDLTDTLMNKLTPTNSSNILNRVIEEQSKHDTKNKDNANSKLCIIKDYLCDNFESKDLVLFCSDLLKKVYDKSL